MTRLYSLLIALQRTLFLVVIFFLPTQLGMHFWPDFSYVRGVRIDYLSPTLYVTDLLLFGLFLVTFLLWVFRSTWKKGYPHVAVIPSTISRKGILVTLSVFVALSLSLHNAVHPLASIYGMYKIAEMVMFGWIAVAFFTHTSSRLLYISIFSMSMIVQSLVAIGQFYTQGSLNGPLYWLGERTFTAGTPGIANTSLGGVLVMRPYGTLPHPNVLAGFLLISLLLVFIHRKDLTKLLWGYGIYISLFLYGITLLLTMSRTAVVLGVCLVILLVRKSVFVKSRYLSINWRRFFLLLLLGIVVAALSQGVFYRIVGTQFLEESITQRMELVDAAFSMFLKHPLIGVGWNNFYYLLPSLVTSSSGVLLLQPVHNIFLLVLSQAGLLGMITVLLLFVSFVLRLKTSGFLPSSLFLVVVVVVTGMVDHYWLTVQQGQLLLAFVVAYVWSSTGAFVLRPEKNFRKKRLSNQSK